MPTITPDPAMRAYFLQKLQERCAPVRNEIHASDLVLCLRKAFFRRTQNRQLSLQQLIFYLDGHQRHAGFQGLVPEFNPERKIANLGVVGHPDLAKDHPLEIKTTRASPQQEAARGKPSHYLRQCAYYCVLWGADTCTLITQYINDAEIAFETVKFAPGELAQYKRELVAARDALQAAFDANDPALLPDVNDWQCQKCEFAKACDHLALQPTEQEVPG